MKYLKDAFIQLPPTDLHTPCLATLKVIYLIHGKIIYHFFKKWQEQGSSSKGYTILRSNKRTLSLISISCLVVLKAMGENKYQEFSLCSHGNLGIDGNRFQDCF